MTSTSIQLPPANANCATSLGSHCWAQRMLDASIASYFIPPDNSHFECKYWEPIGVKGQARVIVGGDQDIDGCFVATTTDDWVVLSLRGTLGKITSWDGIKSFFVDWMSDAQTELVYFDKEDHSLGKVHQGFLAAMHNLWPCIQSAFDDTSIDLKGKNRIQITGHSKGAAMTFLAAMLVKQNYPSVDIQVNAFAAPQVGDTSFATTYNGMGLGGQKTIRHQHAHDIVPFLPPYTDCIHPADSWNVFEHLPKFKWWPLWHLLRRLALREILAALKDEVQTGYARMGDAIYYECGRTPVKTPAAEEDARQAILSVIQSGDVSKIARAHSAVDSYWPALNP